MKQTAPAVRSSRSDPLRIDEVSAGERGGLIGITFCPGKCGPSLYDFRWERDIAAGLDVIVAWGARAVGTLIEAHEFALLGVPDLGARVLARGIDWHDVPIPDVRPPGERFETGWQSSGPVLRNDLLTGNRVLVHCSGELGRGRSRPGCWSSRGCRRTKRAGGCGRHDPGRSRQLSSNNTLWTCRADSAQDLERGAGTWIGSNA